jgi:hypothetical protein
LINPRRLNDTFNNEMAVQKWGVSTGRALYSMRWLRGPDKLQG